MARPRSLPDSQVYATALSLIATGGEKSVTFSSVSQKTGLAGASLVQRYGGLEGMVKAALTWGWACLDSALTAAETHIDDRGPQGLLKLVSEQVPDLPICALIAASHRDAALREQASAWRQRVEAALTARNEAGPMVFSLWMGQWMWEPLGGKGFKLKDAAKRLQG